MATVCNYYYHTTKKRENPLISSFNSCWPAQRERDVLKCNKCAYMAGVQRRRTDRQWRRVNGRRSLVSLSLGFFLPICVGMVLWVPLIPRIVCSQAWLPFRVGFGDFYIAFVFVCVTLAQKGRCVSELFEVNGFSAGWLRRGVFVFFFFLMRCVVFHGNWQVGALIIRNHSIGNI